MNSVPLSAAASSEIRQPGRRGGRSRVLVVEDEKDIANLVKQTVERDGDIEAQIVHSGDAALRVVSEWAPDLVILDLNLPDCCSHAGPAGGCRSTDGVFHQRASACESGSPSTPSPTATSITMTLQSIVRIGESRPATAFATLAGGGMAAVTSGWRSDAH